MKDLLTSINALMADVNAESAKFLDKGNAAAGRRARVAAQEMRVLLKDLRAKISEMKKA